MLAQWPPTLVMGGPAVTTVGYTPPPLWLDERQSSTAKRRSPRSRTVVTPAARWRRRLSPMTAVMPSWLGSPIRSRVPSVPSPHRCTCASTSPGSTVPPGTSSTSQPSGAGAAPGSTPTMRPSSSNTSAPPGTTRSPSNALPARTPNINPPGLATHRHCHHRRCRARSSAPAKQSWPGSALTVRDGYGPAAISRTSGGLERL